MNKEKQQKKRKEQAKTILIVIACIIVLIILLYIALSLIIQSNNPEISENKVVKIIDGDTFQLASGYIVRLICIDAPETGTKGAEDSTNFLASIIHNQEVRLVSDKDDTDSYGRLLRYIYVSHDGEELFVNREMVKNNFATLFPYGNSTEKCDEILS